MVDFSIPLNALLPGALNALGFSRTLDSFGETGTADDTSVLTQALDWLRSSPGQALTIPPGNYNVDGRLNLAGLNGVTINAHGAVLRQLENAHTIFANPGESGSTDYTTEPVIPMTGDFLAGSKPSIPVSDVSGISVGDLMWIRSRQTITPFAGQAVRQPVAEIFVVGAVDAGAKTVTPLYPITKDYIKDTVNNDPYFGGLYKHGLVKATGAASVIMKDVVIRGLTVSAPFSSEKYQFFLRQVKNLTLEDCSVINADNGFVIRGDGITHRRCKTTLTAVAGPTYRGEFSFAPDTGSSNINFEDCISESTNSIAYLHLHEGLSNIRCINHTLVSQPTSPTTLTQTGSIMVTGGSWNVKIDKPNIINGSMGSNGQGFGGIRVANNDTLMPLGHKGMVISEPTFSGNFAYYPFRLDDCPGDITVISPDFINVTCSLGSVWFQMEAAGAVVIEPRIEPDNLLVSGSAFPTAKVYAKGKSLIISEILSNSPNGLRLIQRLSGEASPRIFLENSADSAAVSIYEAQNSLVVGTSAVAGSASGTTAFVAGSAATLLASGSNGQSNLSGLFKIGGNLVLKRIDVDLTADSGGTGYYRLRILS